MSAKFLKVSCRDCSHESVIFSRATTSIVCAVCGSLLTNPAGGKAQLVGCNVVETLESMEASPPWQVIYWKTAQVKAN